ncbi:MAG: V-type ATPase subunit [Clostridia bacterium]|nr:V-type ATPase subunit [Clostridia bacterium]
MSFSENAIMTRSRAIYAKRLTNQNYRELLNCSSVSEAADYLSTKTQYFDTFASVTSAKINRMMLESLLRRDYVAQFSSLYKFSKIIGNEMCRYFVMINEISVILSCLRYVMAPNKLDIFISVPTFEDMSVGFDVLSLANSEDFSEMLTKLRQTEYYDVLKSLDGERPDVLKIENALYGYLDKRICEIAKKSLSSGEYKQVFEIIATDSDLRFISKLFRLKKYYHLSPEQIREYGFNVSESLLTKKETERMITAQDEDGFIKALGSTAYAKDGGLQGVEDITHWARAYKHEKYSKKIMYSTCPNVVMMCSFFLKDNEVKNITSIIEGIKYGLEPDEIKKYLVGFENATKGGA